MAASTFIREHGHSWASFTWTFGRNKNGENNHERVNSGAFDDRNAPPAASIASPEALWTSIVNALLADQDLDVPQAIESIITAIGGPDAIRTAARYDAQRLLRLRDAFITSCKKGASR